jgi:hypothetical protein
MGAPMRAMRAVPMRKLEVIQFTRSKGIRNISIG